MAKAVDEGHIPGPIFIPNCAAVRLIWSLPNGKQANNVLHGSYTSFAITTQAQVNTLYTAIAAGFTSSGLAAAVVTTAELVAVGVRNLAQSGTAGVGFGEFVSNLGATAGTATGDALPANVSFVVSLKTGLSLQANRGRVYLTGYAESANQPGGIASDAAKNASVAFMGTTQSAMTAQGLTLCIAHPARAAYTGSTGTPHPARGAGTVQVTSILALNNVWDSTRLRSQR